MKFPSVQELLSAKAFCVSGPTVCNSLSNNCKQAELVTTSKLKLKSELFYLAYTVNSPASSHRHSASDSVSTHDAI